MRSLKWIRHALPLLLVFVTGCSQAVQIPAEPADPGDVQAPVPVTEPAPSVPESLDVQVEHFLSGMTQEQKIAQIFFVTPEALKDGSGRVTDVDDSVRLAFSRRPVGGLILAEGNLRDSDQTHALLSGLQEISMDVLGFPLFLGVDEEGGTVARISGSGRFGVDAWPDMASVTETSEARRIGETMGEYLSTLGFNLDFAPVADVLTEPANTVVRYRAFSDNPETVTKLCAAFSDGLQSRNVLACYKHFPGHGATAEDSHKGFSCSMHTPEELFALDLPPFREAVAREIPFIMVGHVTLPNVTQEEVPASLSHEITSDLLRSEMGFRGVAITDSMDMGAITKQYSYAEAAVQAVLAGEDMLLISQGFSEAYDAVTEAVANGTIPSERLDEAVDRILRAKLIWQAGL